MVCFEHLEGHGPVPVSGHRWKVPSWILRVQSWFAVEGTNQHDCVRRVYPCVRNASVAS